jgi:apolipoprotein N-acyltransferase
MPRFVPRLRTLRHLAAAGLSGVLLHLAFPGANLEVFAWIGLLPLLAVLWPLGADSPRLRHPFLIGCVAGFAFFLPDVAWVRHSSRVIHGALDHTWIGWGPEMLGAAAVLGLVGYLALYFGLWAWFIARFALPRHPALSQGQPLDSTLESLRCASLAAAAWVACEWLRGWMLTGFGWNGLGVALHRNSTLIQIADVVGVAGLAFLPVFIACVGWINVIRLVRQWRGLSTVRTRLDFTVAMVLLLGVALYGMLRIRGYDTASVPSLTVRTLLVQPNVPQAVRWAGNDTLALYQRLDERTRLYAEARNGQPSPIDLVVWPENAMPIVLDIDPESTAFHQSFVTAVLGTSDFTLLTGVGTRAKEEGQFHNSAVLFQGSYDHQQRAHKQHLVPFGEYLPFRDQLPFMETLLGDLLPGDFRPGASTEPLTAPIGKLTPDAAEKQPVQLIPLICFEDTVGRFARKFIRPAPQILANITNDGWFLQSNETEIHLANSLFRAVELRRPMLRAANTGVSCFIDPLGRITSRLTDPETGSSFIEGCLPGIIQVPKQGELTFYARFGDAFALACLALVTLVTVYQWRRRAAAATATSPT